MDGWNPTSPYLKGQDSAGQLELLPFVSSFDTAFPHPDFTAFSSMHGRVLSSPIMSAPKEKRPVVGLAHLRRGGAQKDRTSRDP